MLPFWGSDQLTIVLKKLFTALPKKLLDIHKDTISIGSGDRVSGADRMGMEVHLISLCYTCLKDVEVPQLLE